MHSFCFVEERYNSESCLLEGPAWDLPHGFHPDALYMTAAGETGAAAGHECRMAEQE
jgi:hypothetical protein